jgi:hypothetical protein
VPPLATFIDRDLLQAPAQDMSRGGTAEWTLHIKYITESWAVIVAPGDHAMVLRAAVFAVSGAEPDTQRLYFSTAPSSESDGIDEVVLGYDDPRTLREYGLEDGMTLHLALQSKATAAAVKVEEETTRQEEEVARQARLKAHGERVAKARAEAQKWREQHLAPASSPTASLPAGCRLMIWIGAIVVWQAGLWTEEPVVVLSATGIAIALLLLGWCASGRSVAEHETGFCLWDCDGSYDGPDTTTGAYAEDCEGMCWCCGYARACMLCMTVLGHLVVTVISVAECSEIGEIGEIGSGSGYHSVLAAEEPFLQCGTVALWGIAPIAVFILCVGLSCVTCPCWFSAQHCDSD